MSVEGQIGKDSLNMWSGKDCRLPLSLEWFPSLATPSHETKDPACVCSYDYGASLIPCERRENGTATVSWLHSHGRRVDSGCGVRKPFTLWNPIPSFSRCRATTTIHSLYLIIELGFILYIYERYNGWIFPIRISKRIS